MMTEKERNDYFYVCSLIEYIARETLNHRSDVVTGEETEELLKIFSSFISDEISDFRTDLYYQNPDYLEWSYREGKLLE